VQLLNPAIASIAATLEKASSNLHEAPSVLQVHLEIFKRGIADFTESAEADEEEVKTLGQGASLTNPTEITASVMETAAGLGQFEQALSFFQHLLFLVAGAVGTPNAKQLWDHLESLVRRAASRVGDELDVNEHGVRFVDIGVVLQQKMAVQQLQLRCDRLQQAESLSRKQTDELKACHATESVQYQMLKRSLESVEATLRETQVRRG
jgi:hypothetical protein